MFGQQGCFDIFLKKQEIKCFILLCLDRVSLCKGPHTRQELTKKHNKK